MVSGKIKKKKTLNFAERLQTALPVAPARCLCLYINISANLHAIVLIFLCLEMMSNNKIFFALSAGWAIL